MTQPEYNPEFAEVDASLPQPAPSQPTPEQKEKLWKEQLVELTCELAKAKLRENTAKALRLEAEQAILQHVQPTGGKKSRTISFGPGDPIKSVTVTYGENVTANVPAILALPCWDQETPAPVKPAFDQKGYAWYRANRPDIYRQLVSHVTSKPAKPSVKYTPND